MAKELKQEVKDLKQRPTGLRCKGCGAEYEAPSTAPRIKVECFEPCPFCGAGYERIDRE